MINSSCNTANENCMAVKMKYTLAQIKVVLIRMFLQKEKKEVMKHFHKQMKDSHCLY